MQMTGTKSCKQNTLHYTPISSFTAPKIVKAQENSSFIITGTKVDKMKKAQVFIWVFSITAHRQHWSLNIKLNA